MTNLTSALKQLE